ncbi:MAG: SWIM zinc finger family protein, partial [Pseudanabaena sp.]
FPLTLQQVIPVHNDGKWFIRDHANHLLAINPRFERGWATLALSGGHPVMIFGEWSDNYIYPLSIWVKEKIYGA